MAKVGEDRFRCPRCGDVKPRTAEHFYFGRTTGRVTGYCKPCHRAWWAAYWPAASEYQRAKARKASRDWNRRKHGVPPGRYAPRYRHEGAA